MKYIIFNADKDLRLPGEFEYRDLLFTRSSAGRILRMLLDKEWAGDRIAILPTDKWESHKEGLKAAGVDHDPVKTEFQNIVVQTESSSITPVLSCDDSFIVYDWGSVYSVDKEKRINRFDTIIPLITIDPPEHLFDTNYPDMNGKWAFKPIYSSVEVPEGKEDISIKYDVEGFYNAYSDEQIMEAVKDVEIPEDGLWIVDVIGLVEGETEE